MQQRIICKRHPKVTLKGTYTIISQCFIVLSQRYLVLSEKTELTSTIGISIYCSTHAVQGLACVQAILLESIKNIQKPETVATLDMDATLVETNKKETSYCYKKVKTYQPLNVYWAEQEIIVHSEFRDGNVPAGYEQLRILKEALEYLTVSVEMVRLRSDTAGYQHNLMAYCEMGKNKRFGKIEFAIGANVTTDFKKAVS